MASLPYPRTPLFHVYTPLSSASRSSFHFSPHLFSSSYSLLLSSASVDADARNGRRGCSYRPTRMTFVDVSQCQTFTFVLPNRCFCGSRPHFPYLTPSFSCNIFLCFPRSAVLSCCVHSLVAVLKTASFVYNIIMCASTTWYFNCKQLLKRT